MATQADLTALAAAEAARHMQLAIRRDMARDVTRAWRVLDFQRLARTWPAWLTAVTTILTNYHQRSAADGALFYRATRQLELGDPGSASLADPPTDQWTARALGYAGPGVYDRQIRAGVTPQRAERAALTQVLGTSTRIVLDGTRTTVEQSAKADPEAVGWYFATDADPCYFCAMIASRGIVFKHDSFELSNAQFIGKGTAKVHDHCGCILAPAFSRSQRLPHTNRHAAFIWSQRGDGDALNAFRRAWEADRANRPALPAAA